MVVEVYRAALKGVGKGYSLLPQPYSDLGGGSSRIGGLFQARYMKG